MNFSDKFCNNDLTPKICQSFQSREIPLNTTLLIIIRTPTSADLTTLKQDFYKN